MRHLLGFDGRAFAYFDARQDDPPEQFAVRHAVGAPHLDELCIHRPDAVLRIDVDREEDAERDEEDFRNLIDAEPENDKWYQRQVGHVADHLQQRVRQPLAPVRHAVGKPQEKADRTADRETSDRAQRANPDILQQLSTEQQPGASRQNLAWRRQHA